MQYGVPFKLYRKKSGPVCPYQQNTYNAVCQYRTNLKLTFWKKYPPFAEKNVCYCFNKMKPNTRYFPRINCEGKSGNSVN